jgi:WD40 repeat protein
LNQSIQTASSLSNQHSLSELHHKILAANHGSFDDFIKSCKKENPDKKSFTSDEYHFWLFQKEKNQQTLMNNAKKRQLQINSNKPLADKWFKSSPCKAFLLNRFEGHKWEKNYLKCSFLDDETFCSTSEDGYLCVWNVNQSLPIQKQKISNLVLNDIAVQYMKKDNPNRIIEEKIVENENERKEDDNQKEEEKNEKKIMIALGCDDCIVRVL